MNKLSADSFRSLADGLLRSCNYDLSSCSISDEARRVYRTIALRRRELAEAEPLRKSTELSALKANALARSAELLLVHESRIATAGSGRNRRRAVVGFDR